MKLFLLTLLFTFTASASVNTYVDPQSFRGTMTTTQRDALLLKKEGMVIYNTTGSTFQLYTSGAWTDVGGGSAGANTTLSNLGVTAINADLIPASDGSKNLGSASAGYAYAYVRRLRSTNGAITLFDDIIPNVNATTNLGDSTHRYLDVWIDSLGGANGAASLSNGLTTPSGTASASGFYANAPTAFYTLSSAAADANATGTLYLETGNKTAGTGNSGDIKATTGTSAGGTRGAFIVVGRVFRFPVAAADPASATEGDAYENNVSHKLRVYNGTIWTDAN